MCSNVGSIYRLKSNTVEHYVQCVNYICSGVYANNVEYMYT